MFGLSNDEGNHGEDVKEEYYYVDSTPTHAYLKALYKYPQREYPYQQLVDENRRRSKNDPEFELVDTGIFSEDRYFDVQAEYAKTSPNDILIKITATNHGPDPATIHLVPQLYFRNTWAWGRRQEGYAGKPRMRLLDNGSVECTHATLGQFVFRADTFDGHPPKLLFTENETNLARLFHAENYYPYVRDAFHEYLIRGVGTAINPANMGTKCGAYYGVLLQPGASVTIRLRLSAEDEQPAQPFGAEFDRAFKQRTKEADDFYAARIPGTLTASQQQVARQAYAGLLWSKQFYHYVVQDWLKGDPAQPAPPPERWHGRNHDWKHLYSRDVISMPDKWEYPWFASWDLAFHLVTLADIDPQFAKDQLLLFLREWYMHAQGQIPAYEFSFSDVNPPVHAWAVWRVYKISGARGRRDLAFLERAFHKLLINFTWWVNRKDVNGKNIFGGGFLGLDNIGVFDRSSPLPFGESLEQADGTAWMAFFCGTMLSIALELAGKDPVYEDVASKFFEHFVGIVDAINTLGGTGLWDDDDGFYYDHVLFRRETSGPGSAETKAVPIKLRSMVGLVPLFAVEVLDDRVIGRLAGFKKRMDWFLTNRSDLARFISYGVTDTRHTRRLLAVPSREKLGRMLKYVFSENEFLSPNGLRSLSRIHLDQPYTFFVDGKKLEAHYTPGPSDTSLFGGNSNWRGPIWFPLNYLFVEALERYHHFYGDSFQIEYPTGSGKQMSLKQISDDLARRLTNLFIAQPSKAGSPAQIPALDDRYANDPNYQNLLLFNEYFHGDTGQGLGASHQTGWTSLVARLLLKLAPDRGREQ